MRPTAVVSVVLEKQYIYLFFFCCQLLNTDRLYLQRHLLFEIKKVCVVSTMPKVSKPKRRSLCSDSVEAVAERRCNRGFTPMFQHSSVREGWSASFSRLLQSGDKSE
ncbi:hypothetical protein ILYODFUR_026503 [Ilyodon furcidens]|uniref:Secreted protein n=1 Tax=Ilyodon furcidens TaxID=33524 RepID=A0ABV0TZ29_9TELE